MSEGKLDICRSAPRTTPFSDVGATVRPAGIRFTAPDITTDISLIGHMRSPRLGVVFLVSDVSRTHPPSIQHGGYSFDRRSASRKPTDQVHAPGPGMKQRIQTMLMSR